MTAPLGAPPAGAAIRVAADAAAGRLDSFLAAHLGVARNQIQAWIRSGRVLVDGRPAARPSEALRAGTEIRWDPPARAEDRIEPEAGALALLHVDPHLLAIDKPAGLVVHPGAGRSTGTLVHRLLARFPELAGVGGPGRPGVVHRLDRDTSGVMLVARTEAAYRALVRQFGERRIDKRYLAIVHGRPRTAAGSIEAPIGRHATERQRMAVRAAGRPARTGWRVRATCAAAAWLEIELHTGRTHQIRVHLKHLGHPLIGDPVYGENRWRALAGADRTVVSRFPRPALHAWRLALEHPVTGEPLRLEAPVPSDLVELWTNLGGESPRL